MSVVRERPAPVPRAVPAGGGRLVRAGPVRGSGLGARRLRQRDRRRGGSSGAGGDPGAAEAAPATTAVRVEPDRAAPAATVQRQRRSGQRRAERVERHREQRQRVERQRMSGSGPSGSGRAPAAAGQAAPGAAAAGRAGAESTAAEPAGSGSGRRSSGSGPSGCGSSDTSGAGRAAAGRAARAAPAPADPAAGRATRLIVAGPRVVRADRFHNAGAFRGVGRGRIRCEQESPVHLGRRLDAIPEAAVDATLRAVIRKGASGSRIVFDYFLRSALDSPSSALRDLDDRVQGGRAIRFWRPWRGCAGVRHRARPAGALRFRKRGTRKTLSARRCGDAFPVSQSYLHRRRPIGTAARTPPTRREL